jgi:hypothetical protein
MRNIFVFSLIFCSILLMFCSKKNSNNIIPTSSSNNLNNGFVNLTIGTYTYSCQSLDFNYGQTDWCGPTLQTAYSTVSNNNCIPRPSNPNDVQFSLLIGVPRDSLLLSSFVKLNKRFQVYSNSLTSGTLCPLIMTLTMDSLFNMNHYYVPITNNDTTQQYVVYTKFEYGGKISKWGNTYNSYFLTGSFKCDVRWSPTTPIYPSYGDFRVRVICN